MNKCRFTPEQLFNYSKYEKVRKSGRFNMYDPRACIATGLEISEYRFVMENFDALRSCYKREH